MKRRSFRFRIALISAGISGLVLMVFGLVVMWSLTRSQLRSLDSELKTFGYRFASRSGPNVDGERQEETLIGIVGVEAAAHRFFAVFKNDEKNRRLLFQSSHWPERLDPAAFEPGSDPLDPQPEVMLPPPKPGDSRPDREARIVFEPQFITAKIEGRRYRLGVFSNREVILINGADLDHFSQELNQLRNAFLVALPAALLVIAFGAWWLGRKALRPIRVLDEDMRRISARDLDQRLKTGQADVEFARIIETYNAMLERLKRSFHQANRFSADVSHELKTPLAIMRGALEQGLEKCRNNPEAQEVFSQLLEQTGRQGAILESLLLLSRADAGKLEISAEKLDLSALLETWLEDASLLAESRDIEIHIDIAPGIEISGDPVLLQRVAHNLFSNAVRYNHDGGRIECQLWGEGDKIRWTVANTGEAITESNRERVFERFEKAASVVNEIHEVGSGLGLSLVREIVTAHGGRVAIQDMDEKMTVFEVCLKRFESVP